MRQDLRQNEPAPRLRELRGFHTIPLSVAIPFSTLELAVGRYARGSVLSNFKRIGPGLFLFGWLTVLLTLLIDSY